MVQRSSFECKDGAWWLGRWKGVPDKEFCFFFVFRNNRRNICRCPSALWRRVVRPNFG